MKFLALSLLLVSSLSFSSIKLDLDLYNSSNGKEIKIKKSLDTALDTMNTFKVPNSNRTVEFTISKTMPKSYRPSKNSKEAVLIDMKVFEEIDGDRTLISSPQIITRLNNEATLEEYDTETSTEKPVLKLKVNPKQVK
jgi:ADP-glucose pyrophosphorylase